MRGEEQGWADEGRAFPSPLRRRSGHTPCKTWIKRIIVLDKKNLLFNALLSSSGVLEAMK